MSEQIIIRKYKKALDESMVMDMIANEEGWDYANENMALTYKKALEHSISYVAVLGKDLCGFSRSIEDNNIYIYVSDLLVKAKYRGSGMGNKLMQVIYDDYPNQIVYVMSDVDGYYEKLGYKREGSLFEVSKRL